MIPTNPPVEEKQTKGGYDFATLLKNIPPGAWVAISDDEQRVVAYAADMRDP